MKLHVGVLLLCFVAGCARFQHQPLSPVETAARLQERTLDNPALRTFLEKNL
ncbi:MAG: TolC family protein, partial [Verrucomicrobia bacterium]